MFIHTYLPHLNILFAGGCVCISVFINPVRNPQPPAASQPKQKKKKNKIKIKIKIFN